MNRYRVRDDRQEGCDERLPMAFGVSESGRLKSRRHSKMFANVGASEEGQGGGRERRAIGVGGREMREVRV